MPAVGPVETRPVGVRQALLVAAVAELAEHGSAGISLRAVARRAGVSHAAPKNHFGDRAGLLTAVATTGFDDLADALRTVADQDPGARLTSLGRAYIDFGLDNRALFDLMFRSVELHADDEALRDAQAASIAPLADAAAAIGSRGATPSPTLTVLAWALVHGLVVLVRDGALRDQDRPGDPDTATALAHHAVATFSQLATRLPGRHD